VNTELSIGVCGWCLDRHDARRSIEVAGRDIGLRFAQVGFFTEQAVRSADAAAIVEAARTADVKLVGAFVAFEGEDYASIARIAATGGFRPDDSYPSRLAITRAVVDLAAVLRCPSLSVHAGTVPPDVTTSIYAKLLDRVREVADYAARRGLRLLLETGREPADVLLRFIDDADRINVGVNFDPGNFIIYGTDEPVAAVTNLKGRIELVHMKDAIRSTRPGVDYGRPASLGAGDVQIARVISKLRATGYRGPLLLECDTRETGLDAIRNAADYLRTLVS
jgi:sugar phosphate isomerase/epimerase